MISKKLKTLLDLNHALFMFRKERQKSNGFYSLNYWGLNFNKIFYNEQEIKDFIKKVLNS